MRKKSQESIELETFALANNANSELTYYKGRSHCKFALLFLCEVVLALYIYINISSSHLERF